MSRNHTWLLLPVLILVAGSVFAKQYDVTECGTVIDKPGMYKVTNDILDCTYENPGVMIMASNVILDLKGHTISCQRYLWEGPGPKPDFYKAGAVLVGWFFEGVQNVQIRNGTVIGCDDGILLGPTDHVTITKMYLEDNSDGAITLVQAKNSRIRNNTFMFNNSGIRSFSGTDNRYRGNSIAYSGAAIDLNYETDSVVKCNTVETSMFGVSVGPFSTGNTLQGNLIIDGFLGIGLYGLEFPPVPPDDPEIWPVPSGNLVKHNMVLGNFMDLQETTYVLATDSAYVAPGATCQNTWMNNQFGSELGPSDCIGFSVELDDEDVCALDDD